MPDLTRHFVPGDVLRGFCNGFFGRDSYGEKTVEAVGRDWLVARTEDYTETGVRLVPVTGVVYPGAWPAGVSDADFEDVARAWKEGR